jgi:hypothetical protein
MPQTTHGLTYYLVWFVSNDKEIPGRITMFIRGRQTVLTLWPTLSFYCNKVLCSKQHMLLFVSFAPNRRAKFATSGVLICVYCDFSTSLGISA